MWNRELFVSTIENIKRQGSLNDKYVRSKEGIYKEIADYLGLSIDTIKGWTKPNSRGPGAVEDYVKLEIFLKLPSLSLNKTYAVRPKVFISYARGTDNYNKKVHKFAQRLVKDGIEIVIDIWSLKMGNDIFKFVERCVDDESITNVLILCDPTYTKKANQREGGVGVETQIISSRIYNQPSQTKFLPVIIERDEKCEVCKPTYLNNILHFDFTTSDYDEEYNRLIRTLYKQDNYGESYMNYSPDWLDENGKKKKMLVVCDVEGTIFQAKFKIAGTDYASTLWQPIAQALGPEAEQEELETHKKWENKEYNNYVEWVTESAEIHKKYDLRKETFEKLIQKAEYMPGVKAFFGRLDREKFIPVLITGGFGNLAMRAGKELGIETDDIYYSCRYDFDENGRLSEIEKKPYDFDDKIKAVDNLLDYHGKLNKYRDWIFIGDGKNDVNIATLAPKKFAINAHDELKKVSDIKCIESFMDALNDIEKYYESKR